MTTPQKLATARDPDTEPLQGYDLFPACQSATSKGNLPEFDPHVTIDEVFRYFGEVNDGTEWDRIHQQLFNPLAELPQPEEAAR